MGTREIVRLGVVESTSSTALQLGRQGAAAGTVVVAESQTGGRGRLHRHWLSPPHTGLYFSIILRPRLSAADLPKITLAAGVAVCRAIENGLGLTPKIKWPNDILLDDRKVGGILSETGTITESASGPRSLVVVGIGLNIKKPATGFPPELQDKATALAEHLDKPPTGEDLVLPIADGLDSGIGLLEQGQFRKILDQWKERDGIRGRKLTWLTPAGGKVIGTSLGPDPDGMLQVRDAHGKIHTVISGDVELAGQMKN